MPHIFVRIEGRTSGKTDKDKSIIMPSSPSDKNYLNAEKKNLKKDLNSGCTTKRGRKLIIVKKSES